MTRSIRLIIRSLIALALTTGILASTLVAPQPAQAASNGTWENLGIFSWGGNGIWGAAPNDIWAVGDYGAIAHFDGVYWNTVPSPTGNKLEAIWGAAADNIYAVGFETIIHYDGTSWSEIDLGYDSRYADISGTGPNNIWVVGCSGPLDQPNTRGVVVHYDGTTWARSYPDYQGWFEFFSVSCVTETFIGAVGQIRDAAIFRWTGTEWVPTTLPFIPFEAQFIRSIHGNYAVADKGVVLSWNGTAWSQMPGTTFGQGGGIWAFSDNDIFVSGAYSQIWHWDGSNWQLQLNVGVGNLFGFWGSAPNNVFSVAPGSCWRYDGSRWREMGVKASLIDIYGTSLNSIWVCGEGEYVGHFDGTGWYVSHPVPYPWGSKHHLHGIWASGPNDVFVVGHGGFQDEPRAIFHYDGTSWSEMNHPAGPLYAVWGTSPNNVFAVGDYYGWYVTYPNIIRYEGSNWIPMTSGTDKSFRDIWGSGPNDIWAVGANGLIAHYNGIGNSWTITPSPTGYWFEGIWGSGPNDIFIVGEHGVIYHFDGFAWTAMTSGTETRLVGVWGSSPSNVFATGENGIILHYDGNTWSIMSQPYATGCLEVWGATGSAPVFYAAGAGNILRNGTSFGNPPAVTTGGYTNLGPTTVTLSGNLTDTGSAGAVNVCFKYGTTPGGPYPGSTSNQSMTNTGIFNASVTNLTSNTTYYYRAVAVGDGTVYGIERSFTTPTVQPVKVVFVSNRYGNDDIFWMYANGSNQTRLTDNPAKDASPALSPDGTRIAFTSWRDGNPEIYVMNADGTGVTRLTNNPAWDIWPAWSPDGTKIAFVSQRDGNSELYVMNADGTGQSRLTNGLAEDVLPTWSPDGTKIAFTSDRDGNPEIYVMNADGTGVTRLTNNPATDHWPAWSPDGSKIVFMSVRDGNAEIYVMNTDGSNQVNVTNNTAADTQTMWISLSIGNKIVFTSWRLDGAEIWSVFADGTGLFRLTTNMVGDFTRGMGWPPQATTNDADNITSHSATLNGNLDSPGLALSANVSFVWGMAPGLYPHETTPQSLNAPGAFSFNLPNLAAGTTYYFRAKAVNDSVDWGAEKSLTTLSNRPPVLGALNLPVEPVIIGSTVNGTASFSDLDTTDTHTGIWDWGDNTTSAATIDEASGAGTARGSHTYTEAGVYEVKLTLTDSSGASVQSVFQYVVVYDPSGGFVTGGGWFTSPAGAYSANETLTGKATFGFVAKYQKGANVPTGQTEFQFHVANLNFHSESYDWLVVAGANAQYKGTGTINGAGTYRFMLTAIDGDLLAGGKGADKFRIRIWGDNGLIYDNQLNSPDTDEPTTVIGGGNIVIHK